MKPRVPAVCCASFALLTLAAPARPATRRPFTLDASRHMVGVSSPEVSPDGRTVLFLVSRPNYGEDRTESQLYAVELSGGTPRPLTFDRPHVSEPRWSPDGRWISFLAPDSADHQQVWIMSTGGGEARRATHAATDVAHYAWRPDAKAIAYAAPDEAPKKDGDAKHIATIEMGYQDLFVREQMPPQHIWVQSLDSASATRVTHGRWSLELVLPPGSPPSHLSWSPDGRQLAFARVPSTESGRFDSVTVAVVEVATGAIRSLTGATRFQNNPAWSPDGRAIAYVCPREGRGDLGWMTEIHIAPAAGGEGRSLTRPLDRQFFGATWMPDGRSLLVAANDRATVGLWVQPVAGPARRVDTGELVVNGAFGYDVTVGKTGAIVFTATSVDRPTELYAIDHAGARPRALTHLNAWIDDYALGREQRITWRNDGFDEDGIVNYPPNFSPSGSYPLVLLIHGGPQSASHTNFSALAQAMASEGWIVFQPNYRGSDNLGNAYMAAITGDAGPGPGRDVMAGVDALRKLPYVSKAKPAVTGWSYGGYMTTWLIGNYPDAWQCAMAGAPVSDLVEEYDLSDGNVTMRYAMGGSPWTGDRLELYRRQSPITYVGKVKTPTLFMSLEEDFRVPPAQALAFYRALVDNGVEARYIAFPGRGHNPRDPAHQLERGRLWIEWVKQHMPATTTASAPSP